MCHQHHDNGSMDGFPKPNQEYPNYQPQHHPPYATPYTTPYYEYYQPPPYYSRPEPRYPSRSPPPFYESRWRGCEPSNPPANDSRITVSNSGCGTATTSNVGNTTMTNCNNNQQGNHHVENHGHMRTQNQHGTRNSRVGRVSSNGGNASADSHSNGFMTNAKVQGATNNNSGYQNGGAGGCINIGGAH